MFTTDLDWGCKGMKNRILKFICATLVCSLLALQFGVAAFAWGYPGIETQAPQYGYMLSRENFRLGLDGSGEVMGLKYVYKSGGYAYRAASWKSSDTSVIKVVPEGKYVRVLPVGVGKADLIAVYKGKSYKTSIAVDKRPLEKLFLSDTKMAVTATWHTSVLRLYASYKQSDYNYGSSVEPVKASWKSSDTRVVTVIRKQDNAALLTPVSIGKATITAAYKGVQYKCVVTVRQNVTLVGGKPAQDTDTDVYLRVKSASPYVQPYQLGYLVSDVVPNYKSGPHLVAASLTVTNAEAVFGSAENIKEYPTKVYLRMKGIPQSEQRKVRWSSSDKRVAIVNENGVVTCKLGEWGVSRASVVITAKYGGKAYRCKIKVRHHVFGQYVDTGDSPVIDGLG